MTTSRRQLHDPEITLAEAKRLARLVVGELSDKLMEIGYFEQQLKKGIRSQKQEIKRLQGTLLRKRIEIPEEEKE